MTRSLFLVSEQLVFKSAQIGDDGVPTLVKETTDYIRRKGKSGVVGRCSGWRTFVFMDADAVCVVPSRCCCTGMEEEGLFRISGSASEIDDMRKEYDRGKLFLRVRSA